MKKKRSQTPATQKKKKSREWSKQDRKDWHHVSSNNVNECSCFSEIPSGEWAKEQRKEREIGKAIVYHFRPWKLIMLSKSGMWNVHLSFGYSSHRWVFSWQLEHSQEVPVVAQWLMNPTRNPEVAGLIPDLSWWVKDPALPWAVA